MILEELCNLARREGLLSNPDYESKPVAWIVALGERGKCNGVIPTAGADPSGKKLRPKTMSIPRRTGRTSSPIADFLVDKSEYVLGVEPDAKRSAEDLTERAGLFRQAIHTAADSTGSSALESVAAFLENADERAWASEQIAASGYASNDLFAFEYSGTLVHELPEVQAYFSHSRRASTEPGVQCLICGAISAPVDKHPVIKIPGGSTSGVALVSFNSDAFESYGLERNENAPVCRDCADAYSTALNRLLNDRYPDPKNPGQTLARRFVRLSPDTTAIFWADQTADLLDLFAGYFDAPNVESVRTLLEAPYKGKSPSESNGRFYCLVLSGGQGRATLRGMHTDTVAKVEAGIRNYFASIEVEGAHPPPLRRLLESVVLPGKRDKLDNLPPGLVAEVFTAIVFSREFPQTLLARAVGRCRAERKVTRERASLLRGYLIRNLKREVTVALDKENSQPGYRLGRLLAVLERVQNAAQKNPTKTIVDRFYGSASTRPGTVFPRLVALAQHHLAKLNGGNQTFYQKLLGEVMDGIATPFNATLNMDQQGLFALGYYHQRQDFFAKTDSPVEDEQQTESEEQA